MNTPLLWIGAALLVGAQDARTPKDSPQDAEARTEARAEAAPAERIAWYTSWEDALAESQRTNRPILVHAAAPQCSGVPGMW